MGALVNGLSSLAGGKSGSAAVADPQVRKAIAKRRDHLWNDGTDLAAGGCLGIVLGGSTGTGGGFGGGGGSFGGGGADGSW